MAEGFIRTIFASVSDVRNKKMGKLQPEML